MKIFRKILAILGCFVVAFVAFISFTPNKVAYAENIVTTTSFDSTPVDFLMVGRNITNGRVEVGSNFRFRAGYSAPYYSTSLSDYTAGIYNRYWFNAIFGTFIPENFLAHDSAYLCDVLYFTNTTVNTSSLEGWNQSLLKATGLSYSNLDSSSISDLNVMYSLGVGGVMQHLDPVNASSQGYSGYNSGFYSYIFSFAPADSSLPISVYMPFIYIYGYRSDSSENYRFARYCFVKIEVSAGFTIPIGVDISYGHSFTYLADYNTSTATTSVTVSTCRYKYFDAEGRYYQIELPYYSYPDNHAGIESNRTYFFLNDFDSNSYYQQGYGQGFNDGVAEGSDSGYASGYSAGRTVGYASGYNAGLDTADYSFFDLFGSVIDAPVTVFKDLFNFELLGVNLLSLFTGLLTLAVLIWIIKLIFGRS